LKEKEPKMIGNSLIGEFKFVSFNCRLFNVQKCISIDSNSNIDLTI